MGYAKRIRSSVIWFQLVCCYVLTYTITPGCNSLAVAFYAAAGFTTFGMVVASAATPAVLLACNAGLGTCSATCATVGLLAPTL